MSDNITITNGINKPWELQGTNYDKPEDIVLANLAVGQLAFLGSTFGQYLSTQATVTAELAAAVNKVRDRSAEVASLFDNWSTVSPKLDLVMSAGGSYQVEASVVNLNSTNPSAIDKLVIANNLLDENKITNKFVAPWNLYEQSRSPQSCTYTFEPVSGGQTITGFSPDIIFYDPYGMIEPPPDLQLYVKSDQDGVYDYSRIFVRFQGVEYAAQNIKRIWVPKSSAEIDYLNNQLSFVNSARNSRSITDTTQLVPVISETNSSPPNGSDSMQQPAVTMEIPITAPDFFEFKLEGGSYFYYDKPLDQIPLYVENTLDQYVGSVVKIADNTYRYVVKLDSGAASPYALINATVKPCIKNPTKLQQSEILSQYSDKVVRITQRSTEQTTFVSALTQRYNYFFEAATNILKAFTNLWSSMISNV